MALACAGIAQKKEGEIIKILISIKCDAHRSVALISNADVLTVCHRTEGRS